MSPQASQTGSQYFFQTEHRWFSWKKRRSTIFQDIFSALVCNSIEIWLQSCLGPSALPLEEGSWNHGFITDRLRSCVQLFSDPPQPWESPLSHRAEIRITDLTGNDLRTHSSILQQLTKLKWLSSNCIHGVHKNRTLFSNVWLVAIERFNMMMLHFNCNPPFEMEHDDCLQCTGFFKLAPFLVWRSYNDNSSFNCNLGFKMERGDGE